MPVHAVEHELLKTAEAAEYLRLHPGHLNNLRSRHDGPPFVKLGAAVRYRRSDLDRWLDANARCVAPEAER